MIELRIPRVNEPAITPDRLRRELFDAAAAGDEEKLTCLCQIHEKSIFEQGMIWAKVPQEIQSSPALKRWYGNGLKAIATYCAERLGKPELMNQVRQIEALPDADQTEEDGEAKR
ncbi:MAG: hypothetical protein ABSB33_11990 [Tepidisphaeraceae bacterium]